MDKRFKIEKVEISITDLDDAANRIIEKAKSSKPCYVCVTNVRASCIGNNDENYCRILNNSFLTVPDGKPIEWYAHLSGLKQVKKTSGTELFNRICETTQNTELTHFFYGSSPEIICKMRKEILTKWPKLSTVGFVSPPFKPVEELANSEIFDQINRLKPTFVWVGLGAPKQERFMDLIIDRIESSILIGVGLVFEYYAGTVKRAPFWMQKIGLEWTYLWFQQPKKAIRSYPFFFSFLKLMLKKSINK